MCVFRTGSMSNSENRDPAQVLAYQVYSDLRHGRGWRDVELHIAEAPKMSYVSGTLPGVVPEADGFQVVIPFEFGAEGISLKQYALSCPVLIFCLVLSPSRESFNLLKPSLRTISQQRDPCFVRRMERLFEDIPDPRTGNRMRELIFAMVDPDSTTVYIRVTDSFDMITTPQPTQDNMK
mmetsp:Transcript_2451/g.4242  ORF Transcript_2451/g.4242 Transcript_2451/m.4242 type:complete len:179 (-) Transcript_2451:868-1404(-)